MRRHRHERVAALCRCPAALSDSRRSQPLMRSKEKDPRGDGRPCAFSARSPDSRPRVLRRRRTTIRAATVVAALSGETGTTSSPSSCVALSWAAPCGAADAQGREAGAPSAFPRPPSAPWEPAPRHHCRRRGRLLHPWPSEWTLWERTASSASPHCSLSLQVRDPMCGLESPTKRSRKDYEREVQRA